METLQDEIIDARENGDWYRLAELRLTNVARIKNKRLSWIVAECAIDSLKNTNDKALVEIFREALGNKSYPDVEAARKILDGARKSPIIITRHDGAVEWLKQKGIEGEVISHVHDAEIIENRVVYGSLPLHLAARANFIVAIDIPNLPQDKRGADLSAAEMDEYGARLVKYKVIVIDDYM